MKTKRIVISGNEVSEIVISGLPVQTNQLSTYNKGMGRLAKAVFSSEVDEND